jgi:hypothetical protein
MKPTFRGPSLLSSSGIWSLMMIVQEDLIAFRYYLPIYALVFRVVFPGGGCLIPSCFPTKILFAFLICRMHATFPVHLVLIDSITLIILSELYKSYETQYSYCVTPEIFCLKNGALYTSLSHTTQNKNMQLCLIAVTDYYCIRVWQKYFVWNVPTLC